jgi:ESCRT-I complex subunit VPS37
MEFKANHFSQPNLSGYNNTGASSSPLTIGGGDMSMPINRPGGVGSLALDRRKQINTLLIFNENVSELVPNVQYRMDFTGGGACGPLTMIIHLPVGFPKERPTIRIEPLGLNHPWIENRSGNVIGAPGLNNFSAHSDLGRVVQVIKREFELNPPISTNQQTPAQSKIPSSGSMLGKFGWTSSANDQHQNNAPSTNSYYSQAGGGLPYPVSVNAHQYSVTAGSQHSAYYNHDINSHNHIPAGPSPAINHAPGVPTPKTEKDVIPEVAVLTDSELEELNENKTALLKFCQELDNPIMQSTEDNYQKLKNEIESTVEQNEELSAALKPKRESLVKQYQEYDKQRSEYDSIRTRVEKANSVFSVTNMSKILEAVSVADEDRSDKCAEDFLNGGLSVDMFLKEYTTLRTSHIKKKAKFDSVMQQRNSELKQTSSYNPSWPKH